jgi:hypothetical protein
VEVLDDQDERRSLRDELDESPPRCEQCDAIAHLGFGGADGRGKQFGDRFAVRLIRLREPVSKSGADRLRRRIRLETQDRHKDRSKGPVREPLAIRQALGEGHSRRRIQAREEFLKQA